MKYIWIIMLMVSYLVWSVYSIKDLLYCRKSFSHPLDHVQEYTEWYVVANVLGLFVGSFVNWLYH